jgi:hypothetical protein
LKPWLIGDPDDPIPGSQFVTPAVHNTILKDDLGMLHQPRAEQHAIARHPDDIALQAAKIRQEDFDSLLFALRPAFSDKFVPIGGFLFRAG